MHTLVRRAAVAGSFYPSDPAELRSIVQRLLREARRDQPPSGSRPKAVIVPHAGYRYSGPIAATAYAQLVPFAGSIERVVILGPTHCMGFHGIAVPDADVFETPLGNVAVDAGSVERSLMLDHVRVLGEAHALEHSLEVQLPFLQVVLPDGFLCTPMAAGDASTDEVADVLDLLWGGPETVLVISSDLSHYHEYHTARRIDGETAALIELLRPEQLTPERACGSAGIGGLLQCGRRRRLVVRGLDLRNSGDTSGSSDDVVGYGAFVVREA